MQDAKPVVSLMGRTLKVNRETDRDDLIKLSEARTSYVHKPTIESAIHYAKELVTAGYPQEAVDVYTASLAKNPDSHLLYRHRGHRLITVRSFDRAIADLERAVILAARNDQDEIAPTANDVDFEIWYHLGLAWYLKGDSKTAAEVFARCLDYCHREESLIACIDWLYRSLRRCGRVTEARKLLERVDNEMDAGESQAYLDLLLYYKGGIHEGDVLTSRDPVGDATRGYGVAAHHLVGGDKQRARELLESIIADSAWMAFGHIAAEADLYRADLI